jgi:hypothetical protein
MSKPQYSGPDYPQSEIPLKIVNSSDALFDFAPDIEPVEELAAPIIHAPSPSTPIEPHRSEAWDAIGSHDIPFTPPDDENQVFAVNRHSPNPKTAREIGRIETNRQFGLTGKVNRTPEQDAMVHQAAQAGHDDKEQRRIADGMSPVSARALRMIEAINRGEDTTYLELTRNDCRTKPIPAVPMSEARDVSTPYVMPKAVLEALHAAPDSAEQRKILRRDKQRFIKEKKGFYGLTNKEINKIDIFNRVSDDPASMLKFMDTIYANHRNQQAMETWMTVGEYVSTKHIPSNNLRDMVSRYDEYAKDALTRINHVDFISRAIDDKVDYLVLFQDAFPVNDWMQDYPDQRAAFIDLANFIATKQFVGGGPNDYVTKRARTKKPSSAAEEITWIMEKLGNKNLVEIKAISDEYKIDQINRFEYWRKILDLTRQHLFTRNISETALSRLSTQIPTNLN